MANYTQILYHLVFGTKNHTGSLDLNRHDELCRYITGLLRNKKCVPHQLGGYKEHVHIIFGLHPSLALSDVVKDIKLSTSKWIKEKEIFPDFDGWQVGYGAFTCSWSVKDDVVKYVAGQYEHHRHKPFQEEYVEMLKRAGIEYDERYLL